MHGVTRLGWGFLALVGGVFPLVAGAADAPAVPLERAIYRDLRGHVVDAETHQPVVGAVVSLLYEMAVSDSQGRFVFEKVPLTHGAEVSVRVRDRSGILIGCTSLDVAVRFYPLAANVEETIQVDAPDGSGKKVDQVITKTAITIVDPSAEEEVELRLQTLALGDLSAFCSQCHDSNPCLETASYADVVKTSKDLRGILVYADEMDDFKAKSQQMGLKRETYRKMRYQDTHPDDMNMQVIPKLDLPQYVGNFAYPEGLKLLDDRYVTCGTCHTRHVPTAVKQFVVQSYEEDNKLCFNCHL